jgi:hypothetical protein
VVCRAWDPHCSDLRGVPGRPFLPTEAFATPIFLLDTDEATYALIHRVDPQTGQLTTIGSLPAEDVVVSLAAVNDNVLYAVSYAGALLRIVVSPFSVTTVGDVGENHFVGLAYGDGMLYADDDTTKHLVRIDPATAATTIVGTIRLANGSLDIQGGDLVQAANGTWYLYTNITRALYALDVTTAVATPVPSQVHGETWFTGLAVDYQAGGKLYGSALDYDQLMTIDPNSGVPTGGVTLCMNCPTPYDFRYGDMASPRCTDADRDGFYSEGGTCGPKDCNDGNAAVNPLAAEACNGRDDDCDGVVDDGASAACNDGNACTIGDSCQAGACRPGTPRNCGLLNLIGAYCRSSDGACCGKLRGGILPSATVCIR